VDIKKKNSLWQYYEDQILRIKRMYIVSLYRKVLHVANLFNYIVTSRL